MSFGNRTNADNRTYNPTESYTPRPRKPRNNDALLGVFLPGVVLFFAITAVGGLMMFVERPIYTYKVSKVRYTNFDMAVSEFNQSMSRENKQDLQNRIGVDFSLIFTPPKFETTEAMKLVASTCLPANGLKRIVTPHQGHRNFVHATRYLSCAMKTRVNRLCNPAERKRLVAQLMQYLTVRQHMFAIERARNTMLGGSQAGYVMKMAAKFVPQEAQSATNRNPQIGKQLDARVAHRLKSLAKNGYISASDFSWMGLSAPKVYAPLIKNAATPRSCRA